MFYVVFSLFRLAAIVQGVYKRGLDGNASFEACRVSKWEFCMSAKFPPCIKNPVSARLLRSAFLRPIARVEKRGLIGLNRRG